MTEQVYSRGCGYHSETLRRIKALISPRVHACGMLMVYSGAPSQDWSSAKGYAPLPGDQSVGIKGPALLPQSRIPLKATQVSELLGASALAIVSRINFPLCPILLPHSLTPPTFLRPQLVYCKLGVLQFNSNASHLELAQTPKQVENQILHMTPSLSFPQAAGLRSLSTTHTSDQLATNSGCP